MKRCTVCGGRIWPWEHVGFRVNVDKTAYWHRDCRVGDDLFAASNALKRMTYPQTAAEDRDDMAEYRKAMHRGFPDAPRTDTVSLYLDGGGDPDFAQIDAFLRTHFNAHAVYNDTTPETGDAGLDVKRLTRALHVPYDEGEEDPEWGMPGRCRACGEDGVWTKQIDASEVAREYAATEKQP